MGSVGNLEAKGSGLYQPGAVPGSAGAGRGERVDSMCSTSALCSSDPQTEFQRIIERFSNAVVRSAAAGFTLRGGLYVLGALVSRASRRRRRPKVTLAGAIEETVRYTAFLGTLAGIYVGVDEGIAARWGKQRTAQWRALVAGACAGPALLLTGPKSRHYSLATYILLRGITLMVRSGNKPDSPPWLQKALAITRMQHGDTLMMCLACSQVIYAFIMMPQTLPPSYVRFFLKQGAKETFVWQGIRELAQRTAAGRALGPLTSLMGTPHAEACAQLPCHFFHPGQGCYEHAATFVGPAYVRALSLYLPVYLLPALLVHRGRLLKQPVPILSKVVLGIARSSLFLSTLIALAYGGACMGHRTWGRSTGPIIAASVWIGGLATLLEKKSRRMELALYVLSRSLESFSRCLKEWGWVPRHQLPARLDVLIFSAGAAAIMHCYSDDNGRHRDVFRSKYLNVFDLFFGNTGIERGSIKHVPSNQDLLTGVKARVRKISSYGSFSNLTALAELSEESSTAQCASPFAQVQQPLWQRQQREQQQHWERQQQDHHHHQQQQQQQQEAKEQEEEVGEELAERLGEELV